MLTAYVVDAPLDDPSAGQGDTDGLVSLREAVTAANTNTAFSDAPAGEGGGIVDTITFDATLHEQTIVLGGTQLVITDHLSITGLGQYNLAISGNNASRVFSIDAGVSVDISDVTIADGSAYDGGGIYNKGTLTVAHATLTGNNADNHQGGGIWSDGTLDITNSTLTGDYSYYEGGGIYNKGTLTITNSTLTGNSSDDQGGGIWNGDTLDVTNGTFSNNKTTGDWRGPSGGGIWNGGTLDITNGTFSNNSAGLHGGGVHNLGGTVASTGSEFSGNSAYSTGGVSPASSISRALTARSTLWAVLSRGTRPAAVAPFGTTCRRISRTAPFRETRRAALVEVSPTGSSL